MQDTQHTRHTVTRTAQSQGTKPRQKQHECSLL